MQTELKKETGLDSFVKYIDIDKKRFHQGINGDKIRKKYNIDNQESVFLYVGRISPHKSIDLLIKAFKLSQDKLKKSKLIIVGKPTFIEYMRKLKLLANKDVIFAGFVNDQELPEYYAACDIYTTTSQWEGYDMPIVEAQACGKKAIAFNCCSHPEVLKNGTLVKNGNLKEYAKAMVDLSK